MQTKDHFTDDIKRANGLKSDAIRAGQKLTIPIP